MNSESGHVNMESASVLVVDDSHLSARKLALAMRGLGHQVKIAQSGEAALHLLAQTPFDIVLLDIIMPEMDGYEILKRLKDDDQLRNIPVIVISSLDDDIASIVKAIELGAEDFLPKSFELEILRARLNASLARKRFRDQELKDLARVEQLTRAALVIESGSFQPSDLELENLTEYNDAIGRLAGVFRRLADEVYHRERQLDQNVRTFRGIVLVLIAGFLFGLIPTLSRIIAAEGAPALGVSFWSTVSGGLFCMSWTVASRGWPDFRLTHLKFLLAWALIVGCLYQIALIVISGHVEATFISLVMSSRAFIVFGLAAIIALERPSQRRLSGLFVGFFSIVVVLMIDGNMGGQTASVWLASTLVLPFLLAIHTLLMSYRPMEIGATAVSGAMLLISAGLIAPFALISETFIWPGLSIGTTFLMIAVLGIATGVGFVVGLEVVRTAGPVFGGQMAYSQALAGVAWAMLLLGEKPAMIIWVAIVLVIFGFLLVEPKRAGEEFRATLSKDEKVRKAS